MKKALVVEDIHDVAIWLNHRLTNVFKGIEVLNCESVSEAKFAVSDTPYINLALVDLGLPDGCGTDVIDLLRKKSSETYIIVTTIYDDDEHIFDSLKSGANGYLLKDLSEEIFEEKLKGLIQGHPPLSSSIARKIMQHFASQEKPESTSKDAQDISLTKRETEILQLVAKGFTRKEIANILGLSTNTIAKYTSFIYKKLNVSTKSEATLEAVKFGLVQP